MEIRFNAAGVAFEGRQALQPLSVTLTERRIGVIGLNGSGKTTFARLINGLNKPSEGKVSVNGLDTVSDAKAVLQAVGFIFQNPQNQIILPIVRDDVAFGLKRLGLGKAEIDARVKAVLARLGIAHLEERRAHEISGGELQLAALAALLVTEPQILILDEPTNGLDPAGRSAMLELISRLHQEQGKSILLSSHLLGDVERVCDSVVILDRGRVLAHGEVSELTSSHPNSYRIQVTGSVEACGKLLRERGIELEAIPARAGAPPRDYIVTLPPWANTKLLFEVFSAAGGTETACLLSGLQPHEENLETVFERIVAGGTGGSADG